MGLNVGLWAGFGKVSEDFWERFFSLQDKRQACEKKGFDPFSAFWLCRLLGENGHMKL